MNTETGQLMPGDINMTESYDMTVNKTEDWEDILGNQSLASRDLEDQILNPHLHQLSQVEWWIGGTVIPSVVGLGLLVNLRSLVQPVYPRSITRLLSLADMFLLSLICLMSLPPDLQVYPDVYISSLSYIRHALQGFQTLSTYLLIILVSLRFLRVADNMQYDMNKSVLCAVLLSLAIFIPSLYTTDIQDMSGSEIYDVLQNNVTQRLEENGTYVVVRRTYLDHSVAFYSYFTMLFKFLVLQVTPVWIFLIIIVSTWKRRKWNNRRRRDTDPLPLTLPLLYILCNVVELTIFCRRILLESSPPLLIRVSTLTLCILYAVKPVLYALARPTDQIWRDMKQDRK